MPLAKALLCQLVACLLAWWLFLGWLQAIGLAMAGLVLLQGLIAGLLSRCLRQPLWWFAIHLAFLPSVWLMLSLHLPSWLYLLSLVAMTLAFWGTVKGDVPLFLSSTQVSDALAETVEREQCKSLVELGAGVGSVVVPLARRQPLLQITAVERAPLPWLILYWRCRALENVCVRRCSLWDCNLADYDLAFAFLSPLVMPRMAEKVSRQMRAGQLFISSSFEIPAWEPETVVQLADSRATHLFYYRVG